jgi:hypothetical protein
MTVEEILLYHRRVMDRIYEGGSIWYDKSRFGAYCIVAKVASDLRHAQKGGVM